MKKKRKTPLFELVFEAIVASMSYRRKEIVREELQDMIVSRIKSGDITTQEDLAEFFKTITLATTALRSIPVDVFKKISG